MPRLAIVGSRDLAQQLATHAASRFDVVGFLDDYRAVDEMTAGGPILGAVDDAESLHRAGRFDSLLIGVGYKHISARKALYERFSKTIPFATLVHSSCYVHPSATIEPGAVIYPGCTVDLGCRIGANTLLNTGTVVAHDVQIGPHTFVGPGVTLAGFVRIGEACFIGVGTTVVDHLEVAAGTQTGAGAVVVRDITAPGLYVGVPARATKAPTDPAEP